MKIVMETHTSPSSYAGCLDTHRDVDTYTIQLSSSPPSAKRLLRTYRCIQHTYSCMHVIVDSTYRYIQTISFPYIFSIFLHRSSGQLQIFLLYMFFIFMRRCLEVLQTRRSSPAMREQKNIRSPTASRNSSIVSRNCGAGVLLLTFLASFVIVSDEKVVADRYCGEVDGQAD